MGYAEKRSDYWRGRYKLPSGKYGTVSDANGATVRFRTKRDAEQAANDAEASVRRRAWRDPAAGRVRFGDYVNRWYAAQDLAASTMQTYRHHIEGHLLPTFEDAAIAEIQNPGCRSLGEAATRSRLCRVEHQRTAEGLASDPGGRRGGRAA